MVKPHRHYDTLVEISVPLALSKDVWIKSIYTSARRQIVDREAVLANKDHYPWEWRTVFTLDNTCRIYAEEVSRDWTILGVEEVISLRRQGWLNGQYSGFEDVVLDVVENISGQSASDCWRRIELSK